MIELGRMAIRLQGLAAPERGDPGGSEATAAMEPLVLGREITRELDGTRDRCVAVCYVDELDIDELMIRGGYARDCRRFSGGRYRHAEEAAAQEGATIGQSYGLPGYCR